MLKRENVGLASTCNAVGQTLGFFARFYWVSGAKCERVLRFERVCEVLVRNVLRKFVEVYFWKGRYGENGGNRRSKGDVQTRDKNDVVTKRSVVGINFVDETCGFLSGGKFDAIETVREGRTQRRFWQH